MKARESPATFLVCEKQTLDHKLLNELAAVRMLDGGVSEILKDPSNAPFTTS